MSATTLPERRKARPATQRSATLNESISSRDRFLQACACQPLDRPPVWLMRQAGRALPEYRELKQKYSFLQLIQTPDLAAEVTLQPIRRFGFDAAILFSDILIVAEALGQRYRFGDLGGIEMDFLVESAAEVERLEVSAVSERLQYLVGALGLIKPALAGKTALLGFAGSPWTLANFMIEGGGVKEYRKAKALFYSDPKLFSNLLQRLTEAVTEVLQMQIDAGVDAVQIFDSLGGILSQNTFQAASGKWIKEIIARLKNQAPVIVFSKGVHGNWPELVDTGAQVIGLDCHVNLGKIREQLPPNVAVQGNLDPFLLTTTPEIVSAETRRLLDEMRDQTGHIVNLGHGVPPDATLQNIESLVTTVKSYAQSRS